MTKIDVVSGFLGAGKTTLIKKLLKDALAGTKVVLIENEFGEIGIDGGFLQESGIEIREMNSGCICCSLVGDFGTSLREVMDKYAPDRILIEPSGVGKLSDVMAAVAGASREDMTLNSAVAVVDGSKCKVYARNFGEFFLNQIECAGTILLTRTDKLSQEKIEEAVAILREHNDKATIITTPLADLDGRVILETIEGRADLQAELLAEMEEEEHHHDDDDDDEDEHEHHHHHHHDDDDDDEDEHEHHHHHHHDDDDDDEDEHEHHHHHHHDDEDEHVEPEEDEDGNRVYHTHDHAHHHHHHHHHHGHDADEIFGSWGMETPVRYTEEELRGILDRLQDADSYGDILRSKGMLMTPEGTWLHFDYVPGEAEIRTGAPAVTGKICVIGAQLKEDALALLFKKKI